MEAVIKPSVLPVLTVHLKRGERIIAEAGELSWKSPTVSINTIAGGAGASSLLGALGRSIAGGGSFFMTEYLAEDGDGLVAFTAKIPGVILEEHLLPGQKLVIHKNGFKAATHNIRLSTAFQSSLGAGFFGGNGFFMQGVEGHGRFWVELGGDVVPMQLAVGEQIEVHPGHVGMFESSVGYEIKMIPGIRNKIFGGDGLFLVKLTGPGRVWLQTLTLINLAHALKPYIVEK